MRKRLPLALALLLTSLLTTLQLTEGLKVLAFSGLMKSHAIAFVPVLEELQARGHTVVFGIPNDKEGRSWFADRSSLTPLMQQVKIRHFSSAGDVKKSTAVDVKTLSFSEYLSLIVDTVVNYRRLVEDPMYSMDESVSSMLESEKPDVIFSSFLLFGVTEILQRQTIPWVSFVHVPALAEFVTFEDDHGLNSRLPCAWLSPVTIQELKASFWARVKNQLAHIFCELWINHLVLPIFNSIRHDRYGATEDAGNFGDLTARPAPVQVALGGGPLTLPLSSSVPHTLHLVGALQSSSEAAVDNSTLPAPLDEWLDTVGAAYGMVIYVGMGTQFVFTPKSCLAFTTHTLQLLTKHKDFRVLWSLPQEQQDSLRQSCLDSFFYALQDSSQVRLEAFVPQSQLLKHPSVRIFLSHCGWGGVTDAINAGVPVLAYPSRADQFANAARLTESGAAILLQADFSNVLEASEHMLSTITAFSKSVVHVREAMQRLGGLERVVKVIEAAQQGQLLEEPQELRDVRERADPFFESSLPYHEARQAAFCVLACVLLMASLFTILSMLFLYKFLRFLFRSSCTKVELKTE
ncbi:hypothetical protein CYMTET_8214 [Cymbomonas tetramitiformis]|uniref:Uncharacterized protein n=1 Tax=Cymbomonas tetramitiformis TaxID=36881 RepID=A0AAE0LGQ3_9CHLO|nr:hypothetical protein CYMTET_8214 [Cymbomonas tetramitiformis]